MSLYVCKTHGLTGPMACCGGAERVGDTSAEVPTTLTTTAPLDEPPRTDATREAVTERITSYLTLGGLFNPEAANHDAVRDLLIDCRAALATAERERDEARELWAHARDGNRPLAEEVARRAMESQELRQQLATARADERAGIARLSGLTLREAVVVPLGECWVNPLSLNMPDAAALDRVLTRLKEGA